MIKYDNLLNLPFVYSKQDCFTLFRDFYSQNYGIEFPNYARPKSFWEHGLNLYYDKYVKHGFSPLHCHPSQYQVGDVFLMAVKSKVGNHIGILVENGQMIHHLWGQLSCVTPYRDIWRNTTIGVFRHKDVTVQEITNESLLLNHVSPLIRRKLNEHLETNPVPS